MWISTDDWTWAGFLLFFAQVAWIIAILNLFIQSLLLIIQIFGGGPSFGTELPVRLDIHNLTEQFNNQLSTEGAYFSIDSTVRTEFNAINIESISNLLAYLIPFMKLGGHIVAVFLLSLIKNVLIPLKKGRPFQPKIGRNLYWIGGIIGLMTPAKFVYEWVIYLFISEYSMPSSIAIHWPLPNWNYLIVGLIILSIAYAFNEGARMAREQKLTV